MLSNMKTHGTITVRSRTKLLIPSSTQSRNYSLSFHSHSKKPRTAQGEGLPILAPSLFPIVLWSLIKHQYFLGCSSVHEIYIPNHKGCTDFIFFKVIDDEKKTQELEAEKNGEKHKKPVDAPYPEGVKKDQVPTVRKRWFTDRDNNGTVDQTDLMMGKCN